MERVCRSCNTSLSTTFIDLGLSPVSNSFVKRDEVMKGSKFYPLHAYVCGSCLLVQLDEYETPEQIFNEEYAYFSSFSASWLQHSKEYVEMVMERFSIDESSKVIEVACNDGYLLQYFKEFNVPVLGIEPSANVAEVAKGKGIPVIDEFFSVELANKLVTHDQKADLLIGNNVLAHVPDINDFVKGLKLLLNDQGIITLEFPHLLELINGNQFDTIYHEHYSYLSLLTVKNIFEKFGLTIFHVELLPTHGSSLRIFARHSEDDSKPVLDTVRTILDREVKYGLNKLETYKAFNEQAIKVKRNILKLLMAFKDDGKSIVGYGAPAKGNTLLNFCGTGKDFFDYVVDNNPYKQGTFLPGTLIPVLPPSEIYKTKPDVIIIMPWNLKDEILELIKSMNDWDAQVVVLIPEPKVLM